MKKIKSSFVTYTAFMGIVLLTACTSTAGKPVAVQPKGPKSVVLIDPSTDDGMLPVIASGMSKGAVTVYPLSDGPLHPIAPLVPQPVERQSLTRAAVTLTPPVGADSSGKSDPRVTVFDMNTPDKAVNAPASGVDLTPMPVLTAPALPPARVPVSPFDAQGTLKSPTDLTAKLPFRKTVSEKQVAAPVTDVEVDRLLEAPVMAHGTAASGASPVVPPPPAADPAPKKRPPSGMTY